MIIKTTGVILGEAKDLLFLRPTMQRSYTKCAHKPGLASINQCHPEPGEGSAVPSSGAQANLGQPLYLHTLRRLQLELRIR